jgi:hypothetical protein
MPATSATLARRIRLLLWTFIIGLVLSGATALPLEAELSVLTRLVGSSRWEGLAPASLVWWLNTVRNALVETNAAYPFIAYGTDWLAFGHFMIAIAFLGPLRDPVRNAWVVDFGIIACALVVPFALIMGSVRGIPLYWRLIDCSFGVVGAIPLWLCRRDICRLEKLQETRL